LTYLPLLLLAVRGPRVIWARLPALRRSSSNNLLVLAGRALVWPLFNLVYRPLFLAVMYLVVLPWSFVVAAAGSLLLLPIIVLSRVTLGPGRFPAEPTNWFQGQSTDEAAAHFLFFSVALVPALYPFTFPLVMTD
jgi:hypothetical protein